LPSDKPQHMTETKNSNPAEGYKILSTLLKQAKDRQLAAKVVAIVNERYQQSLEDYHISTIYADEDKLVLYKELCLILLGRSPGPQIEAKPEPSPAPRADPIEQPAPAAKVAGAQPLFEELCKLAKAAGPDTFKKIAAYLRESLGKPVALPVYHNNWLIPDADKAALYQVLINGIKTKTMDKLAGKIAAGDKRPEGEEQPVQEKSAVQATTPKPPQESTIEDTVPQLPKAVKPEPPLVVDLVSADGNDELARLLSQALKRSQQPVIVPIDEARVAKLVNDILNSRLGDLRIPGEQDIRDVLDTALNNGHFPSSRVEAIVTKSISELAIDKVIEERVTAFEMKLEAAITTKVNNAVNARLRLLADALLVTK
jgi:hypothetical protein